MSPRHSDGFALAQQRDSKGGADITLGHCSELRIGFHVQDVHRLFTQCDAAHD
jgi:hypothetical protein